MSINKIILIGTMGKDAEVRQVGDNKVAQFSLATSKKYKDQSGQLKEDTQWHNIVLWGNEGVYPYLLKGTKVYLEGEINYRDYTSKEGEKRSITEIKCFSVQLVGSKKTTDDYSPAISTKLTPTPKPYSSSDADDLPFD
jgi:single-strand DNA-binding protein